VWLPSIEDVLSQRENVMMVTGYYVIANVVLSDGSNGWVYDAPEGQSLYTSMALVGWAQGILAAEQVAYLQGDDDA
jgi:hypothetical protein